MTEPTTPTGKRLWDTPDIVADLAGGPARGDILAIEHEAAQQERERLQPLINASKALAAFMRSPDKDEDGNPTDWSGSLDIIGAFYAAVDTLRPAPEDDR